MRYKMLLLLVWLVTPTLGLQLTFSKNLMIMNNSFYSAEVKIDRVNP